MEMSVAYTVPPLVLKYRTYQTLHISSPPKHRQHAHLSRVFPTLYRQTLGTQLIFLPHSSPLPVPPLWDSNTPSPTPSTDGLLVPALVGTQHPFSDSVHRWTASTRPCGNANPPPVMLHVLFLDHAQGPPTITPHGTFWATCTTWTWHHPQRTQ